MADQSILAVDFGNVHTRAVLIDLVEGMYRVVARADVRTTAGFPIDDVSVGMRRALDQVGRLTGRTLLSRDGRVISPETQDRSGADIFLATASIGRPLRTVLIGLFPEMSLASLQRAAAGTYITVVETISIADHRSPQERLNAIALANPDLIVLAGGTEDGADEPVMELARITRLALRLTRRAIPPTVLFAGNSALRPAIQEVFKSAAAVLFAENVRPSVRRESVEDARVQLARAFDTFTEQRGAGFEQVSYQARMGVLPTAQGYDSIVRYLGQTTARKRGGVLALDIGSAVSALSASIFGAVSTSIRTDIGLGHSAAALIDAVGCAALRPWLPFEADDDEIAAYAYNKSTRPSTLPLNARALFLEHALMRAAARTMLTAARPLWTPDMALDDLRAPLPTFERIIGAGGVFTGTGRAGMGALLLLDAIQPIGVTRLQLDSAALIPALGALARVNPTAVVQVLDSGGLEDLGTAISVSGTPRRGAAAVSVRVTPETGDPQSFTVEGGTLRLVRLPIGMRATVTVRVRNAGLRIGGKRTVRLDVVGGGAGLIIDARGRPIALESTLKARAEQIVGWYAAATGDAPLAIPDSWLSGPARPAAPSSPPEAARPSRTPAAAPASDSDLDALFGGDAPALADDLPDPDIDLDAAPAPRGRGRGRGAAKAEKPARGRGRGKGKDDAPPAEAPPAKESDPGEESIDDLRSLFS